MLNNRGWGLGTFLGFSLVFIIAIVIASINAYKIGLNDKQETNIILDNSSFNYINAENTLLNAGRRYFEVNNDETLVTLSYLKEKNYLSNIKDNSNNECSGYVRNITGEYYAFLKCGNKYKTNGFVEELDI